MYRNKRALVIGAGGQDGTLLCRLLVRVGYEVHGVFGGTVGSKPATDLASAQTIRLPDAAPIEDLVRRIVPDEIYYLAAHHFSSETDRNCKSELDPFLAVNTIGLRDVLKSVKDHATDARTFYAASAQVFGQPERSPQNERCRQRPITPYGISKSAGIDICRHYREIHGLFVAAGILYNHESNHRPAGYLSAKVCRAAADAARGSREPLVLADMDAVGDWGAAEDYVVAMRTILQQEKSEEFVIATGRGRTVREFVATAFDYVGVPWEGLAVEAPGKRNVSRFPYVGDTRHLTQVTGWRPQISFQEMVAGMIDWHLSPKRALQV